LAETLESLSQKDQFSDQDIESFASLVNTSDIGSKGGGAASLFGVVSLGGGAGKNEARSEASKKQNRQALQQFVKDLNEYRKSGKFPIPPSGRYSMISEQAIRRTVEQDVSVHTPGAIKTITYSTPFSSVGPTLEQQGSPANSVGLAEARRTEQARRDAERAYARAQTTLAQSKRAAGAAEVEFRERQAAWDKASAAINAAVAELNAKSAPYREKYGQHDAAINKPPAAYHRCSADDKMAWDKHAFQEYKAASEPWTNAVSAYQAVSERHCGAAQGELVAALAAFREKLAQHEAALAKPPQAYHGCSVGDKLGWDAFTWQGSQKDPQAGLKAASDALTNAVSAFQAVTDRNHAARLAEAKAALDSARRAVAEAELEVDRRREKLEDLQP
jgi:hypothetical protein